MNLTFIYLEQKGIAPRKNSGKPINWSRLIGVIYNVQYEPMSYTRNGYMSHFTNTRRVNLILEFDICNLRDPIKDFEGILEPSNDKLEFIYSRKHVTLSDVYLMKYDIENQFDEGRTKLIVELVAKDISINSNITGGM